MTSISIKKSFFVLSVLVLILIPYPTQAAERSRSVKDENGMKITIRCETNTSFILEDFIVNLTLKLSKQPDNVIKLFKIQMKLRLFVNDSEVRGRKTVDFAYVDSNTSRSKTTSIVYRNTWRKAILQFQLQFYVDKTDSLPSLAMETEWLNILTLRTKGSVTTNFDWIFIILGAVTFIGVGWVLYKKFL